MKIIGRIIKTNYQSLSQKKFRNFKVFKLFIRKVVPNFDRKKRVKYHGSFMFLTDENALSFLNTVTVSYQQTKFWMLHECMN